MLLLDTCAWLWYVNGNDKQLSSAAKRALRQADRLGVCVISAWEVGMLVAKGKIGLTLDLDTWIRAALSAPKIELTALTLKAALDSTRLPGEVHRDPADRMLIATARSEGCAICTSDEKILGYPHVQSVW